MLQETRIDPSMKSWAQARPLKGVQVTQQKEDPLPNGTYDAIAISWTFTEQ